MLLIPAPAQQVAQHPGIAAQPLALPAEALHDHLAQPQAWLDLGAAGVNDRHARVVALPTVLEAYDLCRRFLAELLDQFRIPWMVLGAQAPAGAVVLAVGGQLLLMPSRGQVVGARVALELPSVLLARAQEQRQAVVNARDDHGDAAGHQPRRAPPAEPVSQAEGVAVGLRGLVNPLLDGLAQEVGGGVQPGLEELQVNIVAALRGERGQLRFEDAAGDDSQLHYVARPPTRASVAPFEFAGVYSKAP